MTDIALSPKTATQTERIWQEFSEELRLFILGRISNPQDAEDILQETFIKIHKKLATLEDDERLTAWLYQIARNTIIDYYRRQKPTETLAPESIENQAVEWIETEDDMETLVASWMKPMVMALPDKYSEALLLTEFEGMTQRELAEHLQLSHSGAKSRVQRGRTMMKEALFDCCIFERDRQGGIVDYRRRIDLIE